MRRKLLSMLPRFRNAYASLDELASRESWRRKEIEAHQLEQLNRLWSAAVKHVPYYRTLRQSLRLPNSFDSLEQFSEQVPVLKKSFVRDSRKQLYSDSPARGGWHHTSGSTGSPTAVYREHRAHFEMLRARYRFNQRWDTDFLDRWVYIWGNSGSLAHGWAGLKHRIKTPVQDWLRNRMRLSPYDLRPSTLRRQLDRIAKFKPAAIYSHSMAAHLLAIEARNIGFECPTLKTAVLTAEPVRTRTVRAVSEGLGVQALSEYGCVECGFIAGSEPDGRMQVREDYVILETIRRPDDRYDIVVTVLNNPSFPLIRYAIGDIATNAIAKPENGFATLGEIEGRDFDFIISESGAVLHGQIFEDIIDRYPGIRRWRVRQRDNGSVHVLIEFFQRSPGAIVEDLQKRFSALLEGYPVAVSIVKEIQAGPSGKHRTIASELSRKISVHQNADSSVESAK
ncbi:MAG: hypothetical protein AAF456_14175 [Planctomycetota bacterium]